MVRHASSAPLNEISEKWRKLFKLLPGYDPIATAPSGCRFDEDAAQKAVDFFHECLTHAEAELGGKPFELALWQQAVVGCIFGWKRKDGTRRYRKVLLYIPRKNGKTLLAAGLAILLSFCDDEPGAQVYFAASDFEQAKLCFKNVAAMIEEESELAGRCTVYSRSVEIHDSHSYMKVLSGVPKGKHGLNVHACVCDELHEQPNGDLIDALETAVGARRQPLFVYMTTADFDRPSVCNDEHEHAIEVRDGHRDDWEFLPIIYEAPPDAPWDDEETWKMANPNYGISLKPEYIMAECRKAKDRPSKLNRFKRLHLNVKTQQESVFYNIEQWDACAMLDDVRSLRGRPCFGGLDLSNRFDVNALAWLFPGDDGTFDLRMRFWIPRDVAHEREKVDRVPYSQWHREGWIEFTDGDCTDYETIEAEIKKDLELYQVRELAYDPYNATQMALGLGAYGVEVVEFPQYVKYFNAPTKHSETLLVSGTIRHEGNPCMRWMMQNMAIKEDNRGDIRPVKPSRGDRRKIDGPVAWLMALGRAILQPPEQPSVYATRGALVYG
jgi:phage terminase large subunit-like protein